MTPGSDGDLVNGGMSNMLESGQSYIVRLTIEVDPIQFEMLMAADKVNQANASGIPVDEFGVQITALDVNGGALMIGDRVNDLSDDPSDLPAADENDPTPFAMPGVIDVTKTLDIPIALPASSGIAGNADVTYRFNICNVGGSDLTQISLYDNFFNEFGSGYVGVVVDPFITMSDASVIPNVATSYTGFEPNTNLLLGTDGLIEPGQCVEVAVTVEVDLDLMPNPAANQALAVADNGTGSSTSDESDNDMPSDPDDPLSDDDDPTPFIIAPSIHVAKSVNSTMSSPTSANHYYITYRHVIKNTGNTTLEGLSLTDDIETALCNAYVQTTNIAVSNIDATALPSVPVPTAVMDGTNDALGNDGLLEPGESFIVDITVEADASLISCNQPLLNQSTVEGLPTDGMGTALVNPTTGMMYMPGQITDDSDSGSIADSNNPGAPNDTGGSNDPTPLSLPGSIAVVKSITNVNAASSGVNGNYDVTIEFVIENTDGINLTNISLIDMLSSQWGTAFVGVVTSPSISSSGGDVATIDPTANPNFDGTLDNELLNNDGELSPGEQFAVEVVVEVDASESPSTGLLNQATVSGTDNLGNVITDISDDNTNGTVPSDPSGDNDTGDGDTGTGNTNDPTPLAIAEIGVSKSLTNIEGSATSGNSLLTFEFTVENTGTTPLSDIRLSDDMVQQLNNAWVGVVNGPIIISSSASVDPTLDMPWDGGDGMNTIFDVSADNMFADNTGTLLPGEYLTVEVVVEVITSNLDNPQENRAQAYGDDLNGVQVLDNSTDGDDPSVDSGGPGTPTPILVPSIELTKILSGIPTAASSGTIGNFDATYTFTFCNNGNVDLSNIDLYDDFNAQFGSGFVGVVNSPTTMGLGTATVNSMYTGITPFDNLLNGDGDLLVGECQTVTVTVEIDADQMPIMPANQANVSAEDPNGEVVEDLSDDNTDLNSDSVNDNESGGSDDPTLFPDLPSINIAKQLVSTQVMDNGDLELTFEFLVENTGNTHLDEVNVIDPMPFLASALPSTQNIAVSITNITSEMAPMPSITYDGGANDTITLTSSTSLMAPGQQFMATVTVEVNPVDFALIMPQPVTNQATAIGTPSDDSGNPLNDPSSGMPYANPVMDLSDDGSSATTSNPGFPGDMGTSDDPTPITLPGILDVTKTLTSIVPAPTPGNALVDYSFEICNIGGVDLVNIDLIDDMSSEFGSGFVSVITAPSISGAGGATANPSYTGFVPNTNLLNGNGTLVVGSCNTVTVQVELDLDHLPDPVFNQAEGMADDPMGNEVTDLSDDRSDLDGDTVNDNETGGEDDPTGMPIFPSIHLAKTINNVSNSPTSVNHFYVTYRHVLKNTGNTILENITLTDDIVTALQGGYVGTTNIAVSNGSPIAQSNPIPNTATTVMDGVNDALDGMSGILNPGEEVIVDITVEVDIAAITGIQPLLNQSTVEGLPTDGMGTALVNTSTGNPYMDGDVTDVSDSGTDADGDNPGAPGDTGGSDDPTPLSLPGRIAVVKTISNVSAASSGVYGNYDVTIDFLIENIGGNQITNINLEDKLAEQWGDAFVGVVTSPVITVAGGYIPTTDPTVNVGFDGLIDSELLNSDGALASTEQIVVQIVAEIDASAAPVDGLENQATVTASDALGNEISDLSDDNTSSTNPADADGDNPNGAGDDGTGDSNNASPLNIPEISVTKSVFSTNPAASGISGNFDVTYRLIVQNTGTTVLENIALGDDFATQLSPAYVGIVDDASIVSSSATIDPNTGTGATLLGGTAGILLPGEQVFVHITIEINASEIPSMGLTNQAMATGSPTDGTGNPILDPNNPGNTLGDVSDVSDSGNDPESTNPDEPGDMGTPDDPTPMPAMPSLELTKSVLPSPIANDNGTYTTTFEFSIANTGNVALANIDLIEDFASQYGCAYVGNAQDPILNTTNVSGTAPIANNAYTGEGLTTNLLNSDGLLFPGDTLYVEITVDIDPNCNTASSPLDNQAEVVGIPADNSGTPLTDDNGSPLDPINDLSDDNTDFDNDSNNDNETGGTDDPTLLYLPNISVTKAVTNTEILANEDVLITFEFEVANTGNTYMTNLSLTDPLSFLPVANPLTQLSPLSITTNDVDADMIPAVSAMYDGIGNTELFNGSTGILAPGQSFTVTLMVEVDGADFGGIMPQPVTNQAVVSGIPEDGSGNVLINPSTNSAYVIGEVADESDDGTGLVDNGDPSDDNTGADGDGTGSNIYDDPTPIVLPANIEVNKSLIGLPIMASSGNIGNYDATYEFEICNIGGVDIVNVDLIDNLSIEFGSGFVGVVSAPSIIVAGINGSLSDPTTNANYSGFAPQNNMLNGDGGLESGECITVDLMIEVDASEMPMPAFNQAEVIGDDPNGDEVTDLSDDNSDLDNDTNNDNETGGTDDPSAFPPLPEISVVKTLSEAVSLTNGDVLLTFDFVVENVGNTYLNNLSLLDDLNGIFPVADPVSQNLSVDVSNISANVIPSVNPMFDGTGDINMLLGTDGMMAPNQQFAVTLRFEVDPVGFAGIMPQPVTNQAEIIGTPVDEFGTNLMDPTDPSGGSLSDVSDTSDDGTDPNTSNPDSPNDMGTADDPTPVVLPGAIDVTKQLTTVVPSSTGNVHVTYEFELKNIGGVNLTSLNLVDDFADEFGSGFVGVITQPTISMSVSNLASSDPTVSNIFTGYSSGNNMFIGTDGTLAPGDSLSVQITVELDLDQLPNPALNQAVAFGNDPDGNEVEDLSDDRSDIDGDMNNDNDTGGEDDPTGLPHLPSISVAKSINDVSNSPTSANHYYITYRHAIKNTGNTILENISLMDDIITALQGGYVGTTNISVLSGSPAAAANPIANASNTVMDGVNDALDGVSGLMNPGEEIIVDITVEIDLNGISGVQPLLNQSTAEGLPTDGMGGTLTNPFTGNPYMDNDITDTSDSGTDADGTNPGNPGDSGGSDDPTPLSLPGRIGVVKSIVATTPSVSGTYGNYDVTIDFVVGNIGGNNLTNIQLSDVLSAQWGDAFVGITIPPIITVAGGDVATIDPSANANYDGTLDNNLLNSDGELAPGEQVTIQVVVEIDASESPASGLENQATAIGLDGLGNEITDISDDNTSSTDPADVGGDNPLGSGDNGTGDTNNPTPLHIPEISVVKSITDVVPAISNVQGNVDVTFSLEVRNTGSTALENISLVDDVVTQLTPAYVNVTTQPVIESSSASVDPTIGVLPNIFDGIDGVLLPEEYIIVSFRVELDASEIPAIGLTNQASVSGLPTDGMGNGIGDPNNPGNDLVAVMDISDSGMDPESTNPGEPGDTGSPDDPTPLQPIPSIGVSKLVDNIVPANSGIAGNYDVTYRFTVENTGTAILRNVGLEDDFASQMGGAFVGVVTLPSIDASSTSAITGGTNASYTGEGVNIEMLDLTGEMAQGENIVVLVTVEIDPDSDSAILSADNDLENIATGTANPVDGNGNLLDPIEDDSDNGMDPDSDNGEGGFDDPTPLQLPSIGIAKTIVDVEEAISGIEGNFDVTIEYVVLNDGNTDLTSLSLVDEITTQWGAAYVGITTVPVITSNEAQMGPTVNMAYSGMGDLLMPQNTDQLEPGKQFIVRVIVEVDASMAGGVALENQATASSEDPNGNPVTDDSDNGIDPSGDNGEGGNDDPTPLEIPSIGVAKEGGTPVAVMGMPGIFDVPYTIIVENTGNVVLDNVSLKDDLSAQFGAAFVEVVVDPVIDASSTAVITGGVNAMYTGHGSPFDELLDNTGVLDPQENIVITLTVRVDGSEVDNPNVIINQAVAFGTDPEGDVTTDDSDSGTDPEGGDDPTVVTLPCFAEIICPIVANPTITQNDLGWCAAIVTFPAAMVNSDCPGVDAGDIEYMLSQDAVDPLTNMTISANTWVNGNPSGLMYAEGITTVTFRIDPNVIPVDGVIDPSTCSFDIEVIDKQTPTTICKDINVYLDANGMASIVANDVDGGTTDNCDVPVLNIDISDFDCTDLGLNNVVLTAEDNDGNIDSCVASVMVIDSLIPSIDVAASDMVVECDGAGNIGELSAWLNNNAGMMTSDNCGEPLNRTYNLIAQNNQCDFTSVTTYAFTSTDASGNSVRDTATFTIEDTVVPTITSAAQDTTLVCDGSNNTDALLDWLNNNGQATATDNCSSVTWTNDYGQVNPGACQGTGSVEVTFTATDACGNSSSTTATLTIVDTNAPVWTIDPTDLTLECTEDSDPMDAIMSWLDASGNGDAFDSCSVIVYSHDFVELVDGCGGNSTTGEALVTFTATDACGNTATREATVLVEDTTPPTLISPAIDTTVECDGAGNVGELNAWLQSNGKAEMADACGDIVWNTPELLETIDGCGGTVEYVYSFSSTDLCDNESAHTIARFTIEDTTSPMIVTQASDETVLCDGSGNGNDLQTWLDNNGGADATDVCGQVTWTYTLIQESDLCDLTGNGTYRFTATDACGNTSTTEATFTIEDTEVPAITNAAQDITVVCDGNNNVDALLDWLNNNGQATATDNCNTVTWTNDYGQVNPGACQGTGSVEVTFTATDACGNSSSTTATLTIVDTNAPVWTIDPTDLTLECTEDTDPMDAIMSWLDASGNGDAFDSCSVIVYSHDFIELVDGCGGNSTTGEALVTFTATDACGNTATREATVLVEDTTPPTLISPAIDTTVECDGAGNVGELNAWLQSNGKAEMADACGDIVWNTPELLETIDGCGGTVEYVYSFSSTDLCDNESAHTIARFTIEDTTSPMIVTQASDETVLCDGSGNGNDLQTWLDNNGGADATDVCGQVTWTYTLIQESDLCDLTGNGTYRFTATDACGNTSTTEATFTIEDTEVPAITNAAQDITVVCDGNNNVDALLDWLNNNGQATATDNCNTVTWTNDYGQVNPGACQGTGSVEVTFTATDACGNSSSTTATLTIVDTNAPVWTIDPTDLTLECTEDTDPMDAIMSWLDASGNGDAFDSCSVIVYSHDFIELVDGCGGNSTTGEALVTFTATDACGNTATREATVLVEDTTPPTLISPAIDTTVECDGAGNVGELNAWLQSNGKAEMADACGDIVWNTPELLETIDGCGRTVEFVYSFTSDDLCGNRSEATIARFTIVDTTSPVIDPTAMNMTVECDGAGNDVDLQNWLDLVANAGATDACSDEALIWEYDLVSVEDSCGITGIQTYRFTVFDNCGNSSTTEGTFTIEDTTPPVITGGGDYSGECDQSNANNDDELISWLNDNAGATADDACGTFVWTNNYDVANFVDGCNDSRNIDVTFYATDECGNVDSVTYNFSTGDNTPPVFTNCPRPPVVVDAPQGWCSSYVNFSFPLATDNCGIPTVEQTDTTGLSTGDLFPVGLTILEFTATDSCGNSSMCDIKIVVNDYHTPPTIVCPSDTILVNDLGKCGAVVNDISATADDNCPDNLAIFFEVKDEFGVVIEQGIEDASGTEMPGGKNEVVYTVQDQPIVLITEILQDGSVSGIEIGNIGPSSMNISCATLTRYSATDTVEYMVPNATTIAVGEVYIYEFPVSIAAGEQARYVFSFLDRVIDEVTINDGVLNGDNIIRVDPVDDDNNSDWVVVNPCKIGSFGVYNPELPVFMDNGGLSLLQSADPSIATCSFEVEILDIEAPACAMQDTMSFERGSIAITPGNCIMDEVAVGAGIVGDVNINDLIAVISNAGNMHVTLTSPEGTEVTVFEGLCDGFADVHVSLDDQANSHISTAGCAPLGNGSTYQPEEEFKKFVGEDSEGTWVLSIYSDGVDAASIQEWTLEVINNEVYAQSDTTIANDDMLCGAEFTWVHPVFTDNCCEGTMTVTYAFTNDVTGESSTEEETILSSSGYIDLDGTEVTKYFEVGKTLITYTLIDLAGNESYCGFELTVEDREEPMFPQDCQDFIFALDAGECTAALNQLPLVTDNCEVESLVFLDENGDEIDITMIPIGLNNITAKATDIYGNMDTCEFTVDVREYIPNSSVLSCNNNINLSLSNDCTATITVDMMLEGNDYRCYDNYCISIQDAAGNVHDNLFDLTDVGQTFQVTISDCLGSNNQCWGYVTIEQKIIPIIECPSNVEIYCNQDPNERDILGNLLTGELDVISCEPSASVTYQDDIIDNGLCSDPRVEIIRVWRLVNNSGKTATCNQLITILPYDPVLVEFPDDLTRANALSCAEVDGNPELLLPEETGMPTLNGASIFGNNFCDINLGYWDEVLQDVNCPTAYSILRHWTIENECLPITPGINPLVHIQRIKVDDNQAPIVLPVEDVTVSVHPWTCTAEFELPDIVHDDDCSEFSTKWNVTYGYVENGVVKNLLKGITTATARVTDACGNSVIKSFRIHVLDKVAPVAVAAQDVVVSLTTGGPNGDGTAKLYVEAFDNGSYDNCTDIHIEVRRDNAPDCTNLGTNGHNNNNTYDDSNHTDDNINDTDGGQYIKFCCEDLNALEVDANQDGVIDSLDLGYVQVFVRVWDDGNMSGIYGDEVDGHSDNYNETWTFVKVEDKLPPIISCPSDATIYCDWGIDVSSDFGSGFQNTDQANFDKTGVAEAYSTCGRVDVYFNDNLQLDDCGVGTIVRQFRASTNTKTGVKTVTCQQIITVLPRTTTFDVTPPNPNPLTVGCTLTQDDLDKRKPTVVGGTCDVIGESVDIDTFLFENGVCKKWVAEYNYMNWCTGEQMGPFYAYFVYEDTEKPVLDNCEDQMFEVDANCEHVLRLTNSATDGGGCTDQGWLKWQVFVDTWADGKIGHYASSFVSPTSFRNWKAVAGNDPILPSGHDYHDVVYVKYVSPTSSANNEEVEVVIEEEVLYGSMSNHKVHWKVSDGCHNDASCSQDIMVVDKKAPTPYCINLSTALMVDGSVELWARDFDQGSFDNCTPAENLLFTFNLLSGAFRDTTIIVGNKSYDVNASTPQYFDENGFVDFDGDGITYPKAKASTINKYLDGDIQKWVPQFNSSAKVFDCDEFNQQGGNGYPVSMSVWDGKLNTDYCVVYISIVDNQNACEGAGSRVRGVIRTEAGELVSEVTVTLEGSVNDILKQQTVDNVFAFANLQNGIDYTVKAEKDINYMNGVSTLDLILIQRHILDLQTLDSPYKMIAADVNQDMQIRSSDLVDLRKLILGITNDLPNNTSWKMVDFDQSINATTPLSYEEIRSIGNLSGDRLEEHFMAIKIGDVNGNAKANARSMVSEPRSQNNVIFSVENSSVSVGEEVRIEVKSNDFKDVSGFQFTMTLRDALIQNIKGGALEVSGANIGILDQNTITMSWNADKPISADGDEVLFELVLKAQKDAKIKDLIDLNSRITNAEAYLTEGFLNAGVEIRFNEENLVSYENQLHQNEPNPFKGTTTITYELKESSDVTFTLFDVTGKQLLIKEDHGVKGLNTIEFNSKEIGASGMIYYQIESGEYKESRKMILLK